ncbi:MAG: Stress responsive alpha-beta barrel [Polaromonas sp.]|nr:Stress responsive alpha-beta barrel [Polaromonas sp.]
MLRHIVMWQIKDQADAPRFKALPEGCRHLIPGIQAVEVATWTAGLEASRDAVLYSIWGSREALAAYQNHPHHRQIGQQAGSLRESRSVMDCEIQ